MAHTSVAVVLPVYNEGDGLAAFLLEIDRHLSTVVPDLTFVIVDDASETPVETVLGSLSIDLTGKVRVFRNPANMGHGPTAMRAYREGLRCFPVPTAIIHVDGDGQFFGEDFPRLLTALARSQVVHGVRDERADPWYRLLLSRCLRRAVGSLGLGTDVNDVNTPFRAYRSEVIATLLDHCANDALVPHVHLTILEQQLGLSVGHLGVRHRHRRGEQTLGTMWSSKRSRVSVPSHKLLKFCCAAACEILRAHVRPRANGLRRTAVPLEKLEV